MRSKLFRKVLSLMFSVLLVTSVYNPVSANSDEFRSGYSQISSYADRMNIPFSMTYDEFVTAYSAKQYKDVQSYVNAYMEVLQPTNRFSRSMRVLRSSNNTEETWYYNTGAILPNDAKPNYSKYNLYNTVRKGDIIFEANGGYGITGHIAIVEGKYYDSNKGVYYIRLIEAISDGVVRSCLDDTRVDYKDAYVYRVTSASSNQINNALNFCIGELGSSYSLDLQKDTSASETDWYCSELVWAAYINQGIDIEDTGLTEPGITPRDIKRSSKVRLINFR